MDKNIIYYEIKEKIIRGEILPKSILTERGICNEYSVSRTPVREVLWRLASDGLIHKDPSREYRVTIISLDKILNIFQIREGIEGIAARIACSRFNKNSLIELNKLGEKIREINTDINPQDHVYYGRQLHDLIVTMTNNTFLMEIYKKLTVLSVLTRNISKDFALIERKSQEAHLKIIYAINEKVEEESERSMREHLRTTCRLMINYYYPNTIKSVKKMHF